MDDGVGMPPETIELRLCLRRAFALGVCALVAGCASSDLSQFTFDQPIQAARQGLSAAVSRITSGRATIAGLTGPQSDDLPSTQNDSVDQPPASRKLNEERDNYSSVKLATAAGTPLLDRVDDQQRQAQDSMPTVTDCEDVSPIEESRTDDRPVYPMDFSLALNTAGGRNPRIQFAQGRIQAAYAELEWAEVLWLPTIRVGTSFSRHDGRLQPANGNVAEVSRGAFYQGLGARAIGSGPPSVPGVSAQFHLADAYLQPRIAGQVASARDHAAVATCNDVLLDTALAYLDLLEALQLEAITVETLSRAKQLAELTAAFAREGEATQADAERAQTELAFRQSDVEQAIESVNVAQARLAQQLSLEATVRIEPQEPTIAPIELTSAECTPHELVAMGLSNRPELAESSHLVAAACERLGREKAAPLVPSVILGMSYGGFGGGRNDFLGNYGDRFDFDAVAFWEVRNLGFGEKAARRQAAAEIHQAQAVQIRLMDQVAREVVESHAQVQARRRQIAIAERAINSAEQSVRLELERIRQGEGLPIEVLQSIQASDAARREYLRTVVEFNEAQFRLHRALGWPCPL